MNRDVSLGSSPSTLASELFVPVQFLIRIGAFLLVLTGLGLGFIFLRDGKIDIVLKTIFAVLWGVGGISLLFISANLVAETLPSSLKRRVLPWVFVGPALLLMGWFLFLPTLRTLSLSFFDATSQNFVGFDNYFFSLTDPQMVEAFRNNILWLIYGTVGSVALGLVLAVLADRSRFEWLAKSLIFMPLAISFVGAAVIWRFVYAYQAPGRPQVGLLNAILTAFGSDPTAFLTTPGLNNIMLIIIFVWMQTGFAMVIFSAAIKGVPGDLLESARIDGANEFQVFFRVIVPAISTTILTTATTIAVFSLKIFDIVFVMTGGRLGTEVIATQQYKQTFLFFNTGRGSAIAVVLLVMVLPVVAYNLYRFAREGGLSNDGF